MPVSRLDTISFSMRNVGIAIAVLWFLALSVVWIAVPGRARMRALSIEGLTIPSVEIAAHSTKVTEASWTAPTNVYVVGWSYNVPSGGAVLTLTAPPGEIMLFRVRGGETEVRPQFLPAGAGYRLRRGEQIRARLEVTTLEQAGKTHGGMALIYFVPDEWD